MRVKFQDEEFIPAVSTGKYIVVTQHFDSPVLDNVDMESPPYLFPNSYHFHTLQVPQATLRSPSRLKYPQYQFFPDPQIQLLQQTPTKSILRKSSYPVMKAPTKTSRSSYSERGIRAFDWSRNDIFSKSFDLPDQEADSITSGASNTATDHEQLVNLAQENASEQKRSSIINIYENRIADLEFYWTDSDSEPLFTAPQSPMSIMSNYLDAESNVQTPVEDRSLSSSNTLDTNKNVLYSPNSSLNISNDNERHLLLTALSSLDSNDNFKLPSLNTPSPESEVSCPIFTFADIHAAPTELTKKIQELSLEMDNSKQTYSPLSTLKKFQNQGESEAKLTEYVIEFSSDSSKTNDEDTDLDFSFIDSLTENSSELVADKSAKSEYYSESVNMSQSETDSSKYITVNVSDRTQNDVSNISTSSNMVTCRSEDSLHEIPIAILEQPSDQDQSLSSCCPL
uniref:Uncharacterized protein n=1 Tax=Cacopsylla melanoneura TaxID=428564 RepID=A0A8D8YGN0_9HEMI